VTRGTGLGYLGTFYLEVGFPLSTFTNPLVPSQSPDRPSSVKAVTPRIPWGRRRGGGGASSLLRLDTPCGTGVTRGTGLDFLGTLYSGVGFPVSTFSPTLVPSQSPDRSSSLQSCDSQDSLGQKEGWGRGERAPVTRHPHAGHG
jgi:hypothetical protein